MKEDKENTRPKERKLEIKYDDGEKTEKAKEKKEAMTKVKLASSLAISVTTQVQSQSWKTRKTPQKHYVWEVVNNRGKAR